MGFEGSYAKLGRAREHLDVLSGDIETFFNSHPYPVAIERHNEGTLLVARLEQPPPLPHIRWALLLGDCVHNLRSALDFVAWELAGADAQDKKTMFPICESQAQFARFEKSRLVRLAKPVREFLDKLQPYRSEKPSLVHGQVIATVVLPAPASASNEEAHITPRAEFGRGILDGFVVLDSLERMLEDTEQVVAACRDRFA